MPIVSRKIAPIAWIAAALMWIAPAVASENTVDFNRDIQPILERSCYACHGPKQQMGKLRLDTNKAATSVVRPGHPDEVDDHGSASR